MKALLIALGLLTQQAPAMKCVEWKPQTRTVCVKKESHPIGGAAIGWILLGPLGGVAGAILGGSDTGETCHEEEVGQPICTRYEPVKEGNK